MALAPTKGNLINLKKSLALAENGYEPQYGARPLRRLIGNLVETQLSKMIVRGEVAEGDTIRLTKDGETIRLERA